MDEPSSNWGLVPIIIGCGFLALLFGIMTFNAFSTNQPHANYDMDKEKCQILQLIGYNIEMNPHNIYNEEVCFIDVNNVPIPVTDEIYGNILSKGVIQ